MIDYDINKLREKICRIFVVAVQNKINLDSFASMLCKSDFIKKIEFDEYDPVFDEPILKTFKDITGIDIANDASYGVFNDAYWAGKNYFEIHLRTKKSFEYIFLRLPFEEMMNLYPVFHEMDFSSLFMLFNSKIERKTILRLLCEKYKSSLNDISKKTSIPLATLKKYNSSDEALYKAQFQTIAKIRKYFDVDYSLFIE